MNVLIVDSNPGRRNELEELIRRHSEVKRCDLAKQNGFDPENPLAEYDLVLCHFSEYPFGSTVLEPCKRSTFVVAYSGGGVGAVDLVEKNAPENWLRNPNGVSVNSLTAKPSQIQMLLDWIVNNRVGPTPEFLIESVRLANLKGVASLCELAIAANYPEIDSEKTRTNLKKHGFTAVNIFESDVQEKLNDSSRWIRNPDEWRKIFREPFRPTIESEIATIEDKSALDILTRIVDGKDNDPISIPLLTDTYLQIRELLASE